MELSQLPSGIRNWILFLLRYPFGSDPAPPPPPRGGGGVSLCQVTVTGASGRTRPATAGLFIFTGRNTWPGLRPAGPRRRRQTSREAAEFHHSSPSNRSWRHHGGRGGV